MLADTSRHQWIVILFLIYEATLEQLKLDFASGDIL